MAEFITWDALGTYAGSLAMVLILTQFTKDLDFTKRIPTQIWSYILTLFVMFPAAIFTEGLTSQKVMEIIFNAIIVSLAANGGYSAIQKGSGTDGNLIIGNDDSEKDLYSLDLRRTITDLSEKKTVTLTIKSDSDIPK